MDLTRRRFLGAGGATVGGLMAWGASAAAAEPVAQPARDYAFGYCLNTGTIRGQKLGLAEQVAVAAEAGYDGIEPWTGDVQKFVEGGGSLPELGKRCADLGLKVVSAIGFASWVVNDDQRRAQGVEQMKREMDQLAQLGGTHIAAPPAGAYQAEEKIDLNAAAERYHAILEAGRTIGIIPQVEVWGRSANLNHVSQAIYVAARAEHPDACVLADAFHMYTARCDPNTLRVLGRQVVHCFHLNDYPADPPQDTIQDKDRIWPGDGVAPLTQILSILAGNHCQVMLSLEVFNPSYWQLPALDAARTGLAKMKKAVAAAKLA